MSDSHTLIDLLNRKLERRRYLNRDDVRRSRQAMTPKPQHISLTFAEAEAIVAALRRQDDETNADTRMPAEAVKS